MRFAPICIITIEFVAIRILHVLTSRKWSAYKWEYYALTHFVSPNPMSRNWSYKIGQCLSPPTIDLPSPKDSAWALDLKFSVLQGDRLHQMPQRIQIHLTTFFVQAKDDERMGRSADLLLNTWNFANASVVFTPFNVLSLWSFSA